MKDLKEFIGKSITVLDDAKSRRGVEGRVLAVGENYAVVEHILYGYGEQQPLPQLYRKVGDNYVSWQVEYSYQGFAELLLQPDLITPEYSELYLKSYDEYCEELKEKFR